MLGVLLLRSGIFKLSKLSLEQRGHRLPLIIVPMSSKKSAASNNKRKSGVDTDNPVPNIEECNFIDSELPQIRSALLDWYDHNHRILPWRRNPHSKLTPETVAAAAKEGSHPAPADLDKDRFIYYVWVCEIMSQQTQVSRAAEYHRKWTAKWPDVHSLAAATQDEVNDMWAGLGYYRRARFLLEGAKYIVNDLGGKFPSTAKDLIKIPGIGAYTANAIASIALGEQVAVVDGNVIRFISRQRQIAGDTKSSAATKLFADLAANVLDPERPGDFNQAMMELGATVCVPNTHPNCATCPVSAWCKAYKAEKQGTANVLDYPTKAEKAEKREETVVVSVLKIIGSEDSTKDLKKGKYLLVKRPAGGLLAGLWEFPLRQVEPSANKDDQKSKMNEYLKELLDTEIKNDGDTVKVVDRKPIGEVLHVFSHIKMTIKAEKLTLQVANGKDVDEVLAEIAAAHNSETGELQWLTFDELEAKGLTSSVKKVLKLYTSYKPVVETKSIASFFSIPKRPDAAK